MLYHFIVHCEIYCYSISQCTHTQHMINPSVLSLFLGSPTGDWGPFLWRLQLQSSRIQGTRELRSTPSFHSALCDLLLQYTTVYTHNTWLTRLYWAGFLNHRQAMGGGLRTIPLKTTAAIFSYTRNMRTAINSHFIVYYVHYYLTQYMINLSVLSRFLGSPTGHGWWFEAHSSVDCSHNLLVYKEYGSCDQRRHFTVHYVIYCYSIAQCIHTIPVCIGPVSWITDGPWVVVWGPFLWRLQPLSSRTRGTWELPSALSAPASYWGRGTSPTTRDAYNEAIPLEWVIEKSKETCMN